MSYWPSSTLLTTALDDGATDAPADARAQLLAAINRLNAIATTSPPGFTRNLIINGCGDVSQRNGGSASVFAAGASGYGGVDRFYVANGLASGTITQGRATYGTAYLGMLPNAIQHTANIAGVGIGGSAFYSGITQRMEGTHTWHLAGKQVTVSFVFRASVVGTYCCSLNIGSTENISCVKTFTVTAANTPTAVTLTFPAIASLMSNADVMGVTIHIGALNTSTYQAGWVDTWLSGKFYTASGATNWGATNGAVIDVTMLQVEEGPFASPYQFRSLHDELMLCRRYWQSVTSLISAYAGAAGQELGDCVSIAPPVRTISNITKTASSTVNCASTGYSTSNGTARGYATAAAAGIVSATVRLDIDAEL
jgi:hypothetical protein